jgi:hypothetical protein
LELKIDLREFLQGARSHSEAVRPLAGKESEFPFAPNYSAVGLVPVNSVFLSPGRFEEASSSARSGCPRVTPFPFLPGIGTTHILIRKTLFLESLDGV